MLPEKPHGAFLQAGTGGRVGNAVVGSGSTAGVVSSCPGIQPAPWAYMPPCLRFSGKNGGATMDGVTSTTINSGDTPQLAQNAITVTQD